MADMVPVTITGVVRGTDSGPGRCERFFVELAATAEGDARRARIGVGDAEAAALAFSLRGQEFPRPMTYQFTASLVAAAGSAVRSVRVTGMADGIFYAQVMLRGGATVDARPSDAINLAAVTGAPVYVAAGLLDGPAAPLSDIAGGGRLAGQQVAAGRRPGGEGGAAKEGAGAVVAVAVPVFEAVEDAEDGGDPPLARPGEGAERVVDAEAHGGLDVRLTGDAAGEGVGGEVGEHGDGAGNDEARGVLGDVYLTSSPS
jgi:bifunctional DNase/RNase